MGLLGKLLKTGIDTALLPVAVVKDVATMGGVCSDQYDRKGETYTATAAKRIGSDLEETRAAIDEL